MKKIFPLLLLAALLAGCSAQFPNIAQFVSTPTSSPTLTFTPAPTVTRVPTQDLFSVSTSEPVDFTPRVTTEISTLDAFPTATATPSPTFPPIEQILGSNFFTPKIEGFERILVSDKVLYWSSGPCVTRNIKFNAMPSDTENANGILLFIRLREKKNTLNVTDWNSGAIMFKETDGSFSYNLRTFNIVHYYSFKDAWIEYQLVVVDKNLNVIGRTKIYDRDTSLVKCNPVP